MNGILPDSWKWKSLREVATINYGKSASDILSDDGEIPVVGTGGVERYGRDYLYDGESIILGRKGTIDRVSFVAGKFWPIDTAYFISNFQYETSVRWLYYFLQTVDLRSLNEATGVPSLSRELLYKIRVPTPQPEEQIQIAEVLSTLDLAIKQTEALIAKQQRIKTGLMQDLLTFGLDEHGNIRSEATHAFKDSPLGRIPVEWDVCDTEHVASKERGSTAIGPFGSDLVSSDYRVMGVPVVFVRDIRETGFRWISNVFVDDEKAKSLAAHSVHPGDVIATKMGLPPCIAAIYPKNMPNGIITADIIRLRPAQELVEGDWVAALLNMESTRKQVREITGGVTRPKITLSDFRRLLITVPKVTEQRKILDRIRSSTEVERSHILAYQKLTLLKGGLMHDLLTGNRLVTPLLAQAAK